MRKFLKVEGSQTLVRDTSSNAILNTDTATIAAAREAKKFRKSRDNEIKELKNELQEMKDLIKQLIEK